jgi:hypothetical protein
LKSTNIQNAKQNTFIYTKTSKPSGNNNKLKTLLIINQQTEWLDWITKFKHIKYSNLDITYLEKSEYSEILTSVKQLELNSIYDLVIIVPDHGIKRNNRKYLKPSFQWESSTDNINITELYWELIKRSKHVHTLTCYFGNYLDSIKNSINSLKHNCFNLVLIVILVMNHILIDGS